MGEIWQAMEQLVREGKILYIGSSNFAGWHVAQAQESARSRHFLGLVSEQSLYNLNERTIELEVIPACEAYGIGLIPWSPLARGLLAGALEPSTVGRRANEDLKKDIETYRSKLEAYDALCTQLGERQADVALTWLLHQKAVTSPIIGPPPEARRGLDRREVSQGLLVGRGCGRANELRGDDCRAG